MSVFSLKNMYQIRRLKLQPFWSYCVFQALYTPGLYIWAGIDLFHKVGGASYIVFLPSTFGDTSITRWRLIDLIKCVDVLRQIAFQTDSLQFSCGFLWEILLSSHTLLCELFRYIPFQPTLTSKSNVSLDYSLNGAPIKRFPPTKYGASCRETRGHFLSDPHHNSFH